MTGRPGVPAAPASTRTEVSTSWMADAACVGMPSSLFYPDQHQAQVAVAEARLVCNACPVRVECLDYAMATQTADVDRHGVWGGLTRDQRTALVRERRKGGG